MPKVLRSKGGAGAVRAGQRLVLKTSRGKLVTGTIHSYADRKYVVSFGKERIELRRKTVKKIIKANFRKLQKLCYQNGLWRWTMERNCEMAVISGPVVERLDGSCFHFSLPVLLSGIEDMPVVIVNREFPCDTRDPAQKVNFAEFIEQYAAAEETSLVVSPHGNKWVKTALWAPGGKLTFVHHGNKPKVVSPNCALPRKLFLNGKCIWKRAQPILVD
jgi:hypothetical protein